MMLSELKRRLQEMVDAENPADHADAEQLLLEYIGDPELTQLWDDAAEFWWYA